MLHKNYSLSLHDLPSEGKTILLTDQKIWLEPLTEFSMACQILDPIRAEVHVLSVDGGVMVRGNIKATISQPCDRCCQETTNHINHSFEDFESAQPDQQLDESRIYFEHGILWLDVAAICWEEFVLALPPNPLCRPDCLGLCPHCGTNLNNGSCHCDQTELDPRMALFRNLKLKK